MCGSRGISNGRGGAWLLDDAHAAAGTRGAWTLSGASASGFADGFAFTGRLPLGVGRCACGLPAGCDIRGDCFGSAGFLFAAPTGALSPGGGGYCGEAEFDVDADCAADVRDALRGAASEELPGVLPLLPRVHVVRSDLCRLPWIVVSFACTFFPALLALT